MPTTPLVPKIETTDIYVAPSTIPNAGYGVFASKDIKKGTVIERAPFLETSTPYGGELMHYVFQSHLNPDKSLVVFGYGSIYNHALNPNVVYSISSQLPSDRLFTYTTTKNVKKGDELFINYGEDHPVNEMMQIKSSQARHRGNKRTKTRSQTRTKTRSQTRTKTPTKNRTKSKAKPKNTRRKTPKIV